MLKKAMGWEFCNRTVPKAVLEAFDFMINGMVKSGVARLGA